ncbi:pyruvoyl-dependent arginine decarboxylase [Salinarchaeum chitinilyticum]
MQPIRIIWGTGRGPTALAAYDAALAEAGVHDYNLVQLSSVIPAGPAIEEVGTAPDLGPAGEGLTVVEASARGDSGPQSAVLAWARSPEGPGVFYEAGESEPADEVQAEAKAGIEAGLDLRDREYGEPRFRTVSIDADSAEGYAAAVAIAAYGESEPLL